MSDKNVQNQEPVYSFQGSSPADELLEIARIHHREAKQLFDSAYAAQAEGREEEARLLMDLAIARRERAEEFERAAKGEGSDPVVTEILDWQEDLREEYTPYTSTYTPADGELPEGWLEEFKPPKRGRIARAVAWVGSFMP
jgi:hypothetical protein